MFKLLACEEIMTLSLGLSCRELQSRIMAQGKFSRKLGVMLRMSFI